MYLAFDPERTLCRAVRAAGQRPGARTLIHYVKFLPLYRITGLDPIGVLCIHEHGIGVTEVIQCFAGHG